MKLPLLVALSLLAACSAPAPAPRYSLGEAVSADGGVELVTLADREAGVEISVAPSRGGELSGLRVRSGDRTIETIYHADDYAPSDGFEGRAPILWPAFGRNFPADLVERRLAGEQFDSGAYDYQGRRYPMPLHGFARDFPWTPERSEATAEQASLQLSFEDSAETREMYPFGFRLSVEYVLQGGKVEIRYGVHAKVDNQAPMFFSIGNHIAFNTPLIPGGDPAAMTLETPSTIELLRDDITMPTGESRPRSHAEPFAIGEWEVLRAVSLSGYAGDPYVVLRDPGGFAIRMSHHASQLPEQPFVQYNVWGDARGGYFSTEPAVGLQNSFVLGQGLINLEPGKDFDWTISIELER